MTIELGVPNLAKLEAAIANSHHLAKLAAQMAPDPTEWSYHGEVHDAGATTAHCSCGHPIRWIFVIRRERDGATLPIGSVCIDRSIPWLTTHGAGVLATKLQGALAQHEQALAEAKKQANDAMNAESVTQLLGDLEALIDWREQARTAWQFYWMPEVLYHEIKVPQAASTPGRTAASLRTRYATSWRKALDVYGQAKGTKLPTLPLPSEIKLQAKLIADLAKERDEAEARAKVGYGKTMTQSQKRNYAIFKQLERAIGVLVDLTGIEGAA